MLLHFGDDVWILVVIDDYGNVLRILVPFSVSDEDLDRGLEIMEESLGDAIRGAA